MAVIVSERLFSEKLMELQHVFVNLKTEDFLSCYYVGLMDELRKSTAWVPMFKQMKKIKKVMAEEVEKNKAVSIAKTMKKIMLVSN